MLPAWTQAKHFSLQTCQHVKQPWYICKKQEGQQQAEGQTPRELPGGEGTTSPFSVTSSHISSPFLQASSRGPRVSAAQ